MGFSSKALVLCVVATIAVSFVVSSMAAPYTVFGWTWFTNFHNWTSSKTFQAGDIIGFIYDPGYHNVLQVASSEYDSCTATGPLASYTTGNDSIPIMGNDDHYYFICGVPNHCILGQKVDIQVAKSTGRTATYLFFYAVVLLISLVMVIILHDFLQ